MDKEILQQELDQLEARLDHIEKNPAQYVQAKLDAIDRALNRPNRSKSTKPRKEGNKTMYQHLKDLRVEWAKERRKGGFVDRDRAHIARRIDEVKNELDHAD